MAFYVFAEKDPALVNSDVTEVCNLFGAGAGGQEVEHADTHHQSGEDDPGSAVGTGGVIHCGSNSRSNDLAQIAGDDHPALQDAADEEGGDHHGDGHDGVGLGVHGAGDAQLILQGLHEQRGAVAFDGKADECGHKSYDKRYYCL